MSFSRTDFLTSTLNQFEPNAIKGQKLDWGTDVKEISCVIDSSESNTLYPGDAVSLVSTSTGMPKVVRAAQGATAFGVILYDPRKTSLVKGDLITVCRNGGAVCVPVVTTCNAGVAIYYDTSAGSYTTTSTNNVKVGMVLEKISSAVTDGKLTAIEVQQQNV